ncbi:MAG: methyl-accepting chemotaxis protein, partial [Devosia sp.]|nr:methyl-accepting chemotaxis protein [Devosia sp.]
AKPVADLKADIARLFEKGLRAVEVVTSVRQISQGLKRIYMAKPVADLKADIARLFEKGLRAVEVVTSERQISQQLKRICLAKPVADLKADIARLFDMDLRAIEVITSERQISQRLKRLCLAKPIADLKIEIARLFERVDASAKVAIEIIALGRQDAQGRGDAAIPHATRMRLSYDLPEWAKRLSTWSSKLDALTDWNDGLNAAQSADATRKATGAMVALATGAALTLAIAVALGIWITRDIGRGLSAALEASRRMAEHDLSHPLATDRGDEIGSLLAGMELMRQRTHALASGVRDATSAIHVAISEIASGSQHLSSRTEHTATTLQSTLSSMQIIHDSVTHASRSAEDAQTL